MFTTAGPVLPYGARLRVEGALKTVNMIVTLGLLACLVVTITDITTRADRTLEEFWVSKGDFDLSPRLKGVLAYNADCSVDIDLVLGDYDVRGYTIDSNTRLPLMAHAAGLIRRGILVACGAALLTILNKVAFNYNIHEIRYHNYVVPKGYLVLLELLGIIWAIVALNHPYTLSQDIGKYIKICAAPIEFDSHLYEAPPFIALFIAFGVVLVTYAVNYLILFNHSARPVPNDILDEWQDIKALLPLVPWEEGLPTEIEALMQREMDGDNGDPGIKHLLARELDLIPSEAVEELVDPPQEVMSY
eukprot:TRINITY_DN21429_c0_g1_i1.p1 TRINITY_DN21429_c0_g1~~TRINITY_DN21429_c0_g1_i1.p1  ORF type:complete len:303 (+),score=99.48 TRINITY_DN21429_c0_g1_i1:314-1222(+)